jgi:hypothetical protein
LGDVVIDGRILMKMMLKKYGVRMCTVAQDRVQRRALVNMVMNLPVP